MYGLKLDYRKIILISSNYFFRLLKKPANQTQCSRLEQKSVINFLVAENFKPCEIYKRMCIVNEKTCLSQKCLQKSKVWVCYYKPKAKRESMGWKQIDPRVMKMFPALWSIKKIMLTVLMNIKGPITINFIEKVARVNITSYCHFLK